jgi:hypothetical protein
MRHTFTDLLKDPNLLEKRLPKTKDFFKQYTNLNLQTYSRYWSLFAFMYDELNDAEDNDAVDTIFQSMYNKFKNKDKRYLDAWKYFAAFKRQELIGKTEGSFVFEYKYEEVTFSFQLNLRDEYIAMKETK